MKKLALLLLGLYSCISFAQQTITGTVTDSDGNPLLGVNISVKKSSTGTSTDFDGKYSISALPEDVLVFSFVGFDTKEVKVNDQTTIDVTLASGSELDEVILVGSRALPRSSTTTSLPIDVLPAKELASTGQITFDKALQYKIPSFNTVQTPVNDATSLLDPYEIRNMGPSRTLILVNGKRKNLSALLYTQTSPGRGETGADISAIPTNAIKRVEVLRDGASAQYGSDAIAGVMNIILKDTPNEGSVNLRTGITSEGDGETIGISLNNGSEINEGKGFLNYTIDFSKVNLANRPGDVDAEGEFADFGGTRDGETLADIQEFLSRRPDAGNINGSPETTAAKFLINGGIDVSENSEVYFNAAYVYKKVNSFANYRTPYWRDIQDFPYLGNFFPGSNPATQGTFDDAYGNTFNGNGYDGYVPTFDGDLNDYNATIGIKSEKNGWVYDGSLTVGGNKQTYMVRNSHNRNEVFTPSFDSDTGGFTPVRLYQENSQISFDPGGTQFNHVVGNLDLSKAVSEQVAIAFGAEFRSETFNVIEGELASYDGGGADSFAGNIPENSGKFNRYNFGGYFDISADITEDFLLNGTVRLEDYSDFGEAFVWKISGRHKFLEDMITLRASISTGFRAPTLHQIYTQKAQYSFVAGQGIQVGGLINNVSPQARLLGIDQLDAEESTNITVGIGTKINKNINFTIDYYNIAVDDRIVLGTEIGPTEAGDTVLDEILANNNLSDLSFFSNAIDTRTSGIDVVANYRNIEIGTGKLNLSLSGNYMIQNERDGEVKNPTVVSAAGQSVVNDTQEALFFTSRPEYKAILGASYSIGKFDVSLNNTLFGPTEFRNQGLQDLEGLLAAPTNPVIDGGSDLRVEFDPKVVTDLGINYRATDQIMVTLNVNNVLNVLPEWSFDAITQTGREVLADADAVKTASNLITFNQRYSQMTYDGYHFSQLGTLFNLSLNYSF